MDETLATDPRGNRYDDDVKERAYQLWAFKCSRRPSLVSDLLAAGEVGEAVTVTQRTISNWADAGQWAQRVNRDLRAIAPDLRDQTIAEIIMGGLDGARYLRAVADGRETIPNRDRVNASLGLIDRAGLSHIGKPQADLLPGRAAVTQLPDVSSASVDELMRIERDLRAKRRKS